MKTFAFILLLFAAFSLGIMGHAAPSAAQTDDVREAVFRALFVRAKAIMPDAKVFILEEDGQHPREWGKASDPSAGLMQRFTDTTPPAVPISRSMSGASPEGVWHGVSSDRHGPLLQIVSLHWLSETSVEAETDIEADTLTNGGLPWAAVSVPYLVSLANGRWIVKEDIPKEWRQAVQEGNIREAVVREQLAVGVYGRNPETTPCFLSFGLFSAGASADPPDTFMERFAGGATRLQKASQRPEPKSRKPYILIGVEHVRWISDTEAEVDGGGICNHFMSADSDLYQVTQGKHGWDVQLLLMTSI